MSTEGNLKFYKFKDYGKHKIRFYLKRPTKGTNFVDLAILCEPIFKRKMSKRSNSQKSRDFLLLNSFKFSRNGLTIRIQDGALVCFVIVSKRILLFWFLVNEG